MCNTKVVGPRVAILDSRALTEARFSIRNPGRWFI
jgi:hypothetical protein